MDNLYPGNSGYKADTGGRMLNLRSLTVETSMFILSLLLILVIPLIILPSQEVSPGLLQSRQLSDHQ